MIKELEDYFKEKGGYFYYVDPLFEKYFGERKLNEYEEEKVKEVYDKINSFLEKENITNHNYVTISYLEDFGYYGKSYSDRGHFDIVPLGEDSNEAFIYTIDDILFVLYHNVELYNRREIQEEFYKKFGDIEYDSTLFPNERSLLKWKDYYDGNLPQRIIDYYEGSANGIWNKENNNYYRFDGNEFVLKKQETLKLDK